MFYVSRSEFRYKVFIKEAANLYHRRELNAVFEIKTSGTRGDTRFCPGHGEVAAAESGNPSAGSSAHPSISKVYSQYGGVTHPLPPCLLD